LLERGVFTNQLTAASDSNQVVHTLIKRYTTHVFIKRMLSTTKSLWTIRKTFANSVAVGNLLK